MRRTVIAALAGLALALPLTGFAAQDEAQKQLNQRAQEAQRKLDAAKNASGPQRQQTIEEHMKLMGEMMRQMQTAKPREGMTPQQMREWMDEHMKLMDKMMGQMMEEHHMMMMGGGK